MDNHGATHQASVQDVQYVNLPKCLRLRVEHHLQVLNHIHNEVVGWSCLVIVIFLIRLLENSRQKANLVDPHSVELHDDLAPQTRTHGRDDPLLPLPPLPRLVRQEVTSESLLHLLRHRAVSHHLAQLVHGAAEDLLVRVHVRHDAAHLTQHNCPRESGNDDHKRAADHLHSIHWTDVAIAHTCDGVAGEVDASQIQLPRRVLGLVGHMLLVL
mmetsp:Transcript_160858/g.511787  ORF Transcript_160858/g.511787 Transcript_160858/m.511787 type:complete len:213 (+) Transcript_160858:199-837(+)